MNKTLAHTAQVTVAEWDAAITALTAGIDATTDPLTRETLVAERMAALAARDQAWIVEQRLTADIDEALAIVTAMPARRPLATVTDIAAWRAR